MLSVSVVIPTYNDAVYLPTAINSVLAQDFPVSEIIVVDDGSTKKDSLSDVQLKYKDEHKIRFILKENGGPSSARNVGLRHAMSSHIAFLDADDQWLPSNLSYKINLLEQCDDRYFGVYGSFVFSNSDTPASFMRFNGSPPTNLIGRRKGIPGGAPAYLFKREALLSIDGFDEKLSMNEDFDLILRLIKEGWLLCGDQEPGFSRNIRHDSLTRSPQLYKKHSQVLLFLQKAEEHDFFSPEEITVRKKENDLVLAKALKKQGADAKEVCIALSRAFGSARPNTLKEVFAYVYLTALRCFVRLG